MTKIKVFEIASGSDVYYERDVQAALTYAQVFVLESLPKENLNIQVQEMTEANYKRLRAFQEPEQ